MCPKVENWYVGCVDVLAYTFLLTSHYNFACPQNKNIVHYTNITEVTRPNYPHFVVKEVRYKNQFDSFN